MKFALVPGPNELRREDCSRIGECLGAWAKSPRGDDSARCPEGCPGFNLEERHANPWSGVSVLGQDEAAEPSPETLRRARERRKWARRRSRLTSPPESSDDSGSQ